MQTAEASMSERLRVMDQRRHPDAGQSSQTEDFNRTLRRKEKQAHAYATFSCTKPVKVDIPHEVSAYNEGLSIRNHTDRTLSIRGRDGTIIRLAPNHANKNLEAGIYYTTGFSGSEFVQIDDSRHDKVRNITSGKILQLLDGHGKRRLEVESARNWYHLTMDELTTKGGSVYLEEIDKILSVLDDARVPDHPFTYTSVDDHIRVAMQDFSESTSGLILYTVDNNDSFGKRYVNLNGNILVVTPRKDPARSDGIYLRLNGSTGKARQGMEFYDFNSLNEGKCPIKFYPNIAEAEQFGNESERYKREMEQQRHEHEMELAAIKREQNLTAIDRQERKEVIDENSTVRKDQFEAQSLARKDKYEQSSAVRKDEYDERSSERKDSSEETKAAIAAVGTLAAVGGIGYKVATRKAAAVGGILATRSIMSHSVGNVVMDGITQTVLTHGLSDIAGHAFRSMNPVTGVLDGGLTVFARLFGD